MDHEKRSISPGKEACDESSLNGTGECIARMVAEVWQTIC
jgi:hypothetical protein